jgi:hypothetical protein
MYIYYIYLIYTRNLFMSCIAGGRPEVLQEPERYELSNPVLVYSMLIQLRMLD